MPNNEDETLEIIISATDPDGDELTYSYENLPSGAQFDNASHTFTWTPVNGQAGTHDGIRLGASDGEEIVYEEISITVNSGYNSHPDPEPIEGEADANSPPNLQPIGDKSVAEGETLSFTIYASDPDGDALTYGSANLPRGASFDASSHTFSWKPKKGQAGTYNGIRLGASDGEEIVYEEISITVKQA
ncbi:MAG: putative Ig domain-containing protein [Dehalococcoidia bacterium]